MSALQAGHAAAGDASDVPRDATLDRWARVPTGVELCYRVDGADAAPPVVLVAGLGQQLTSWPEAFVEGLVEAGFRVVRPDNRDAGRSSRLDLPAPSARRLLLGRPRPDAYRLHDMAADVVGLLDHLGLARAHVVGMSMGGMVAQSLAARWPERTLTLTSLMSTTGHRRVGQPTPSTFVRLLAPRPRTRHASVECHLAMVRHLEGPAHPVDEVVERAWAADAWERAASAGDLDGAGFLRQIQAVQASGDRTVELTRIVAPTLVVHGERDPIVAPSGGEATAYAVTGARWVCIQGMGHHLAPGVVPLVLEHLVRHLREGERS